VTNDFEQLSCQELVELVTDYLEGALPDSDRGALERHLESCDGCRDYVEQMRTTISLAGEAGSAPLTPEVEDALLAAFRDWKTS
jgi:anti-sigma factor RsiW